MSALSLAMRLLYKIVIVFQHSAEADVMWTGECSESGVGWWFGGWGCVESGVKQRRLAVFERVPTATAAILTEAFFIDSVTSAGTLDRWNDAAARAIAQGIEKFLTF